MADPEEIRDDLSELNSESDQDEGDADFIDAPEEVEDAVDQQNAGEGNQGGRAVRTSRRFRALGETYRKDAETLLDAFRTAVVAKKKNAEVTEIFKKLALLLQEAFEESLGLHRDPADDILASRITDSPKIHFLLEKLKKFVDEVEDESILTRLCTTYLSESGSDPDLQYYTAIILYSIVQGLSASSPEDAEDMQIFFQPDEVFLPFMHFISMDPHPPHPPHPPHTSHTSHTSYALPARNAQEIRCLLCGLYGTCFERVVIDEYRPKLPAVKVVVPGLFVRLRQFLAAFRPVLASPEATEEPTPTATSLFRPPTAQPRSSMKRRLDRTKSQTDTPPTPKRKKLKFDTLSGNPSENPTGNPLNHHALNLDETSSCSSWAEYERLQMGEVAQNFRVLPMDENLEVRLILDFLVGLATLDDFAQLFYELDALSLCYEFLDIRKKLNVRILGQVVHFLANLLSSTRFVTKFLETPYRLSQLIKIPYPSIPAVFVVKVLKNVVLSSEYALETIIKFADLVQGATSFMVEAGLKSGHESSRKWASRFFAEALQYRVFMEAFDEQKIDGLRTLLNNLGLYEYFWQGSRKLERQLHTDEQLLAASEALTSVFQALICYFTTDMVVKAEWYRQDLVRRARESGKEPPSEARFPRIPFTKAVRLEKEELENLREYMLMNVPLCRATRDRVGRFVELKGIERLFQILEIDKVSWITFRDFSVLPFHKMSLDILEKCVLSRKAQDVLLKYRISHRSFPFTGVGLLLNVAVKSEQTDVQKLALHVLANTVYGMRTGRTPEELELPHQQKKGTLRPFANDAEHFEFVVNALRQQKCLGGMVRVINDAVDADSEALRALACKVLTGMARSLPCKQILRELHFFRTGELQVLMRERLSLDLHGDYVKLEKYATELLEMIFETKLKLPIPVNLSDHVLKQDILKRSRMTFPSQEIDLLLLAHLESRDLGRTASCLVDEVGLKRLTLSTPLTLPPSSPLATPRKTRLSISPGVMKSLPASQSVTNGGFKMPHPRTGEEVQVAPLASSTVAPSGGSLVAPSGGAVKNVILDATDAPATVNGLPNLVGIVANNFRAQHAECEHPIALCPPFSLKKRHRCPAPTGLRDPPTEMFRRLWARGGGMGGAGVGGIGGMGVGGLGGLGGWGRNLDRHYIFSRFKSVGNIEFPSMDPGNFDPNDGMLSVAFLGALQKDVVMGGRDGYIVGYNLDNLTKPTFSRACHEYCETSHLMTLRKEKEMFISCCTESSSLWKMAGRKECTLLKAYENTHYMDIPYWQNHRAVGAQLDDAFIIDLETGERVVTFRDELLQGRYSRNRPSFHPSDNLVTHDGLLFDAKTGQFIHKFDQFERHTANGVFHPNGNEIIIDSEVWDLRNFKLLKSIQAFHQCQLKFNVSGDVIYAIHYPEDMDDIDQTQTDFPGSFTTVDSHSYATIFGMDLRRKFNAMALDSLDNHIALAEPYNETFWTYGRVFQVGVEKSEQDFEDESDEDEGSYTSDDDDDDDATGIFDDGLDEEEEMMDWFDEEDGEEVDVGEDDEDLEEEEEGSGSDEWTADEDEGDEGDDDLVYALGEH